MLPTTHFTTALCLATTTTALSIGPLSLPNILPSTGPAPLTDSRFLNWKPPGANDVRSPCPGLNSLANHGFIPHNGRNNTLEVLIKGLAAGMNVGADFTTAIGAAGLLSSPFPLEGSFDLNDLDEHNFPIEHDGSLSRQDAYFGNDYSFYNPHFQQVLSYYQNDTLTSIDRAARARAARINDSMATNPTFTYGLREVILSLGETALYLQTLSDPTSGKARVDFVEEFFENERLPVNLGWAPSAQPITLETLGNMVVELYAADPQAVPEGVEIAANSYKNLFEVIAGGSNALNNFTQGLASEIGL